MANDVKKAKCICVNDDGKVCGAVTKLTTHASHIRTRHKKYKMRRGETYEPTTDPLTIDGRNSKENRANKPKRQYKKRGMLTEPPPNFLRIPCVQVVNLMTGRWHIELADSEPNQEK